MTVDSEIKFPRLSLLQSIPPVHVNFVYVSLQLWSVHFRLHLHVIKKEENIEILSVLQTKYVLWAYIHVANFELTQMLASEAGRHKERLRLVNECAWIWVKKLRKKFSFISFKNTCKISRDIFVCSPWLFVNCGSFCFCAVVFGF